MTDPTRRVLIAYPFPLCGVVAKLALPNNGLSRAEADRLKEYIESLVVERLAAKDSP